MLCVIYLVCVFVDQWQYTMVSLAGLSLTGMEVYLGLTGGRFIMECTGSIEPHIVDLVGKNNIISKAIVGGVQILNF